MREESACGSSEFRHPLSRFPLWGKAGAGGFPPRRRHATCQQKTLARIDAAGSPHKRAAAPLCIPCERMVGQMGDQEIPEFLFRGKRTFRLTRPAFSWKP
jgi:hypothetical protein